MSRNSGRKPYQGGDGKYEDNSDGDGDPTVDSRPAAPIQDSRPNTGTPTDVETEVEEDEEELETGGEMNHMDSSGSVVGRRNEDLPMENLSTPPTNS